ncbi:MAG: transglycosylase domain-containing protein [Verrucomicrobiales bacterium]|nr:transglycosylase domain-containing protein [Verrucomicrobiales bacterium]
MPSSPDSRRPSASGGRSPKSRPGPARSGGRGRGRKTAKSGDPADGWSLLGPLSRWGMRHPWLQGLLAIGGFAFGVTALAGLVTFLHYDRQAARFDLSQVARMPRESRVYDIKGREIGYLHGDGRTVVPLDRVAPVFQQALVAREDSRFYGHGGIDVWGLMRAALRNLKDRDAVQGASTLTMQLARNTFDLKEKNLRRKLLEMAIARRIESRYGKEEILYLYVNRIFFGSGLNGIEQAARGYFGKAAADLDLAEAAMIAGIIRAPNRFSPYRHYEEALAEMRATINRMVDEGVLAPEVAEAARARRPAVLAQEAGFRFAGKTGEHGRPYRDSYLMEAIRSEIDRLLTPEQRDAGGFEIFTTFDLDLQAAAEAAVERRLMELENAADYPHPRLADFPVRLAAAPGLAPDYLQAAVTVIDNATGGVRALVGGRDFDHSRYNRATQARRQLGSIFKPLVYATAFETGLFPGTYISDDPIRPGEIRWQDGHWSPENADRQYLGNLPASRGLVESRNTMSVRVGERAGIEAVLAMIDHAGLAERDRLTPSPQIYIGNIGAPLVRAVSAYSAFPNDGFRHEPYFIDRVETRDREVIHEPERGGYQVVSPGAAWLMRQILSDALAPGGTGVSVRKLGFKAPAGGKTGTTNDYRDAWFLGFGSHLTAGVWVGLDQPEKIVDRGYGGRLALPIWTDLMLAAQDLGYPFGDLPVAEDLIDVDLCRYSGKLASDACRRLEGTYRERIPEAMVPRSICEDHTRIELTRDGAAAKKKGFLETLRGWFGGE